MEVEANVLMGDDLVDGDEDYMGEEMPIDDMIRILREVEEELEMNRMEEVLREMDMEERRGLGKGGAEDVEMKKWDPLGIYKGVVLPEKVRLIRKKVSG